MKHLLLLLALACWGCRAARQPNIEFRGYEYETDVEDETAGPVACAVFELVNATRDTYVYEQQIGPVFDVADLGGDWPFGPWRCGNGIRDRDLEPGARIRLSCWIDTKVGPIQVTMNLQSPGGKVVQIVGPVVDISEGKANRPIQADAPSARR
jgi:hypothetical protein